MTNGNSNNDNAVTSTQLPAGALGIAAIGDGGGGSSPTRGDGGEGDIDGSVGDAARAEGDRGGAGRTCEDLFPSCPGWGEGGECESNPAFMLVNCPITCDSCLPKS